MTEGMDGTALPRDKDIDQSAKSKEVKDPDL